MATVLLVGCGSSGTAGGPKSSQPRSCQNAGFELSLVKDSDGAASPVQAAEAFNALGGVDGFTAPAGAHWHVAGPGAGGVSVVAGNLTLHSVQFTDKSWAIDSGKRC
jgi:hypothetical protein